MTWPLTMGQIWLCVCLCEMFLLTCSIKQMASLKWDTLIIASVLHNFLLSTKKSFPNQVHGFDPPYFSANSCVFMCHAHLLVLWALSVVLFAVIWILFPILQPSSQIENYFLCPLSNLYAFFIFLCNFRWQRWQGWHWTGRISWRPWTKRYVILAIVLQLQQWIILDLKCIGSVLGIQVGPALFEYA